MQDNLTHLKHFVNEIAHLNKGILISFLPTELQTRATHEFK